MNEILLFTATWVQLEILIPSEVSQKESEIPYDITYMWNLKYGTDDPIYKTETDHGHREQTCVFQGVGGKGDGQGVLGW